MLVHEGVALQTLGQLGQDLGFLRSSLEKARESKDPTITSTPLYRKGRYREDQLSRRLNLSLFRFRQRFWERQKPPDVEQRSITYGASYNPKTFWTED